MNNPNHSPSSGAGAVGEQTRALSLEQRLAGRPQLRQRFETILDILDQDIADGVTADEAEAHARDQVRALGQELLQDWAKRRAVQAVEQAAAAHPHAIRNGKKNSTGIPPLAPST